MFGQVSTQVEPNENMIESLMGQVDMLKENLFSQLDKKKNILSESDVLRLKESIERESYRNKLVNLASEMPAFLDQIVSLPPDQRFEAYVRLMIFLWVCYPFKNDILNSYESQIQDKRITRFDFLHPNNTNLGSIDHIKTKTKFISVISKTIINPLDPLSHNSHSSLSPYDSNTLSIATTNIYHNLSIVNALHPLHYKNETSSKVKIVSWDDFDQLLLGEGIGVAKKRYHDLLRYTVYQSPKEISYINWENISVNKIRLPFVTSFYLGLRDYSPFSNLYSLDRANNLDANLELVSFYNQNSQMIKKWFDYYFNKTSDLILKWRQTQLKLEQNLNKVETQNEVINTLKSRVKGTISSLRSSFPEKDFPTLEDILKEYESRTKKTKESEADDRGEVVSDLEKKESKKEEKVSEEVKELANEKKGIANKALVAGGVALAAYLLMG